MDDVWAIQATLAPDGGTCAERQAQLQVLQAQFHTSDEPIRHHMGQVMASFALGLFVGGEEADLPQDNLDLERWFRQPKGYERRIHGHRHAGVRLVQEGPTLLLALDAHLARRLPREQDEKESSEDDSEHDRRPLVQVSLLPGAQLATRGAA